MVGLLAELYNPGAIAPGVVGGISLILAFFAFQSLPINYAGLLLIVFGIILLVAEIKVVSHGVLAIGGTIAMGLGSLMLFDAPDAGGLRISWWVLIPTVGATAGLFLFVVTAGVRALTRRAAGGASGLIGQTAVARGPLAPEGQVAVQGELWRAVAEDGAVDDGTPVRIVDVQGLTLKVVKAKAAVPGGTP
jgi:membrane-bound serine protease (ClpP class)